MHGLRTASQSGTLSSNHTYSVTIPAWRILNIQRLRSILSISECWACDQPLQPHLSNSTSVWPSQSKLPTIGCVHPCGVGSFVLLVCLGYSVSIGSSIFQSPWIFSVILASKPFTLSSYCLLFLVHLLHSSTHSCLLSCLCVIEFIFTVPNGHQMAKLEQWLSVLPYLMWSL